jgi:NRAMP (natural resistance-associated macrophage protein)-like metal ion transporter
MAESSASLPEEQQAVLDPAHVGDIRGALGTIGQHDVAPRRGLRARLLTLAAILGPGLIVMIGDNDAGGVATYSQAGQNYGTSLLWTLLLLIPVLIVNQEMVVRLGAVTGVGHGKLILERFGRFWGAFSIIDLFVLNFLTIVTEFIGIDLALSYFGVTKYASVPIAALLLVAITATGSFRRWERFVLLFAAVNLLIIPLAVLSHPDVAQSLHSTFVPTVEGGVNSTSVLLIIAIVGTTVAPWQLFFQQSNVIDKRITTRWLNYERADTWIGSVITVVGAGLILMTCAFAFSDTPLHGAFTNAAEVAHGLAEHLGHGAGAIYSIVLLDASIVGAAAVTLATSYAFGDAFNIRHSLHRSFLDAKPFYLSYAGMVAIAAAIVLIPGAPLGLITTAVQALAGVLLPSATVFLLLLCNDRAVLGPWINRPWLNVIASVIVSVLLVLSLVLVVTTIYPSVDVTVLAVALGAVLVVGFAAAGSKGLTRRRARRPEPSRDVLERRQTWRMPPLALLERPEWSPGRRIAMYALRGYLVVAAALLLVRAIQLGTGH